MIAPLRTLAQHCKRLSPLLAAPAALLLSQGQAKAVLTYNIFESGGNVVIQTSGSLDLTGATSFASLGPGESCSGEGILSAGLGIICTGSGSSVLYNITGPSKFDQFGSVGFSNSNVSGIKTYLAGILPGIGIDAAYTSNDPIVSSLTYNYQTLSSIGFTISSGLLGSWTLNGTNETIYACLGADPCAPAAVPGPLPLLGAGAAFGWSRRLRKRIATPSITPPQA